MTEENGKWVEGKHRRLYEENLVRNIMLTTAYCIKDILEENPSLTDEDIYDFIEENYYNIIQDTLDEYEEEMASENGEAEPGIDEELGPDDDDEFKNGDKL